MILNPNVYTKYCDITIVLLGTDSTIELKCHRIILAGSCDYFDRMFEFEPNQTKYTMTVSNATVMSLLIKSFYQIDIKNLPEYRNLPTWMIDLEMIKCRHYLLLDYKTDQLLTMNVPNDSDAFELYVEVACLADVDNNQMLARKIKQLIPPNYDINRLSEELVDLINTKKPILVYLTNDHFKGCSLIFVDYDLGNIISNINKSISPFGDTVISNNGQKIGFIRDETTILMLDIVTNHSDQYQASLDEQIKKFIEVEIGDTQFIISICGENIDVWNCNPNCFVHSIHHGESTISICFWTDLVTNISYIFSMHSNEIIQWNFLTGKSVNSFHLSDTIFNMLITHQSNLLITLYNNNDNDNDDDDSNLRILNLCSGSILYDDRIKKHLDFRFYRKIMVTNNDEILIIFIRTKFLIFDLKSMAIVREIRALGVIDFVTSSNSKEIIYITYSNIVIVDIDTGEIIKEHPTLYYPCKIITTII